ncbi:MAG: ATP-binding cassette domain-containing protein, partial [Sphingomonadales bacterium]
RLKASAGKRSGNLVFQIRNIAKSYGDHVLLRDFSTIIRRRDRIGIIGPNGAGKTTLLKILLGELEPDTGTIRRGSNITPLVIGQKREALGEEDTVRNILTGGRSDQVTVGGAPRNVIAYMKDFLFDPSQIDTPVRILSGGERNRLLLAREFAKPSNLLVLDEPTNDLDMETLDLLAEVLSDYDGTVIIVSHDRNFLDNVVGSTIVFEGDGLVTEYAGGYADYLVQRRAADRPAKEAKRRQGKEPAKDPARKAKPRLSYKHQRALEVLPKKIARLETEILALEDELSDPGLFVRDQERFTEVCAQLEDLKSELEKSEEALLEVEILREA